MKRFLYFFVLNMLMFVIAGCAVWKRLDEPLVKGPAGAFEMELPVGWVRALVARDRLLVTRDGTGIQYIEAMKSSHEKAFSTLKKESREGMLPSELAELMVAQTRSRPGLLNLIVLSNTPANVAGITGFRLHLKMKSDSGLTYEAVIYGFVDVGGFYRISYQAPTLHYFNRDLTKFEQAVKSFRLTGSHS